MRNLALALLLLLWPASAGAQTINVATEAELRTAITTAAPGATIVLGANVTLTSGDLPSISTGITIDGGGHTLSGNNQFRGLLVAAFGGGAAPAQVSVSVTIQNLTIANTVAQGGSGGTGSAGGGGGGGLGGGLFVASQANVTLKDVNFDTNKAIGGDGGVGVGAIAFGSSAGGGGGGLGGNGGNASSGVGGGGGGAGTGADGGSGTVGGAGILVGAAAGGGSGITPGGAQGGGGASSGQGAGGGGNAGGTGISGFAGNGGFAGGGGGSVGGLTSGSAGAGGGGGGGSATGFGGYGGGSGGDDRNAPTVAGGFGGGIGGGLAAPGGGGGAGMGGGVFVESGGQITVTGSVTVNGSSVTGGRGAAGGGDGSAFGAGMFFGGTGTVVFSSGAGETQAIANTIADELGASGTVDLGLVTLNKAGAGTLVLSAANQYSGGTVVDGGTLSVSASANLGTGDVTLRNTSTLAVTGSSTFAQNVSVAGAPVVSVAAGQSAAFNGAIADDSLVGAGSLTVTGGGTLALGNATNSYSGGTSVNGNSTLQIAADGALGAAGTGVTLGDATTRGTLGYSTGTALTTTRTFSVGAGGGAIDTAGTAAITVAGATSGSGALTKSGAGTLTLAGASTRTGATVVGDGVLRAGTTNAFGSGGVQVDSTATLDLNGFNQSVGSLAGAGAVTLGAATLSTGADNTSTLFSGAIGGSGALVKSGVGTLTLTGINTYSGGTTVSGGTLVGTTASLQGAIQNDAALRFDQMFDGIFAGSITGTGTLAKTGTGLLVLNGTNTYTGGTTVSGGALSGTTANLQGTIVNDAQVIFNQATDGAYTGTMIGTGSLVKAGSGTVTLTGANTYSGGTIITGGTLEGDTTSLQGAIQNDAALRFNQLTDGIFGGAITGSGSLTKTGAGTLTLTGNASYTGGTTIAGGTLAGTTQNLQGTIQNDAALLFNQSFGGTFSGSIGGSGSVTKAGTGTVVLDGTNTYTGGTTVTGGSLVGTTASLQGGILNNAQVVFNQTVNGTYAGTMSGSGSLSKTGVGALTLSGINSYAGGTSITGGGAISVAADASLGAAAGAVSLGDATSNGTLTFTNASLFSSIRDFSLGTGGGVFNTTGALVTLFGAIGGTGGLTKTGDGVLELAGTSSYSGPTIISAGTLRARSSNAFGIGNALLVGAGTRADLNGFSQTVGSVAGSGSILLGAGTLTTGTDDSSGLFAGTISGAGALVKSGSGTLILTGANSYSGGTSVLGGALLGNTTSLQGNIFNNGLVQFDQDANGTYTGSMSGSGALAKTGSGILTLTGTSTYSGGTLINGGGIIGSVASLRGAIVNNAQLTFGGDTDGAFGGTLSGIGSLLKTGAGTLALNGAQPLTGLFTVGQGTLALNGSYGGSISVAAGAALRANGFIGGSLNLAGSLFAVPAATAFSPAGVAGGASYASSGDALEGPSYLTIGQNLTATGGSLLDFAIGPGAIPTILVGGTAAIDGARFNVSAPSIGTARSRSFLALATLNGLSLTNSQVTSADRGVIPLLKQDRNSLFVTLINLNVPLRTVSDLPVVDAIDRTKFAADGDAAFVIRELTALDDAGLKDALEQIGGQLQASVLQTAILDSESVTDLVRDQLSAREMEDGNDFRWWGETACQRADFRTNGSARGGRANVCAGAGGADRRLSERWTVGAGGSYTGGSMGLGNMGSGDYTAPRAFGYVGYKPARFGIRGGGSAAKSSYQTERQIRFQALLPAELGAQPLSEGVDRKAQAEQQGATTDAWSEYHDSKKIGSYTMEGLVGVRHARISRGSFTETGAISLSLVGEDETVKLTQTDVKIHAWRRTGALRPFFDLYYRREMAEGRTEAPVRFAGLPNSDFIIQGLNIPASTYSTRLGMTFATIFGQATFTYEYKQAPGQRRQTAGLRFRFK